MYENLYIAAYKLFLVSMILNYRFLVDYSPIIYLDQQEQFYPCSVEYFQNHTKVVNRNGINSYVSRIKPKLEQTLPYFYGQKNLTQVPTYVTILPDPDDPNPARTFANPLTGRIIATYFNLYPYNQGKNVFGTTWDNHVGDIEHVHIYFNKGIPEKMTLSYHSFNMTLPWSNLTKEGDHPVIFSARGSHGLWSTPGDHAYLDFLTDQTSYGEKWETFQNIKFLFPWYWSEIDWLTNIYKWGDLQSEFKNNCITLFGYDLCMMSNGPTGFLGKTEIQRVLKKLQEKGMDIDAGIFTP